jgi:hypothetical protein
MSHPDALARAGHLEQLLNRSTRVWRGRDSARIKTRSTGHFALDARLPGGGWPIGALIEIMPAACGIGELSLPLAVLKALSDEGRPIIFIRPPHTPYPPALLRAHLSLQHILWIVVERDEDARWAAEQTLRAGGAGAVLLWSETIDERYLRRLQLAAETGQALAFLYRDPAALRHASPAALRIALHPSQDALQLQLIKVRGGHTGQITLPLSWPLVSPSSPSVAVPPTAARSAAS